MFSQKERDRLINAMRAHGVTALSLEHDDQKLHLNLDAIAPKRPELQDPAPVQRALVPVKSPGIGRFIACGTDDGLPRLKAAAQVVRGDTLGYIEQRQVRTLVVASADGILASDIPREDTIFGHGDVVFNLEVGA